MIPQSLLPGQFKLIDGMKNYFLPSRLPSAKALASFLVVGLLVGFLVTLQWQSKVPNESQYPLDQLESQKELLQIFVDEQQGLEKEVTDLRQQVEAIQAGLPPASQKEQNLQEELKALTGLSDVTGEGVEVFLGDSPVVSRNSVDNQNDAFVFAADIRDVLNLLFASGAQAVAVNGKRILPLYAVNSVGNTFLVNDSYTFSPITITAIGPKEVLLARLQDKTFLSELHRRSLEKRLRFTYQERADLTVPAYKGTLRADSVAFTSTEP